MASQLTDKIPAYLSRYKVVTNGATDPGQVRTNNEDSYITFAAKQARTTYSSTGPLTVAVLADGVGGATAGERASSMAVDTVRKSLESASASSIKNQVDTAILEANNAVYSAAKVNPELSGMASTIVVALIEDCSLYVAHVGDSRAYLIRDQVAYQLTVDHSWIQSALDAGQLSTSEVEDHPKRHVVTRSLGPQPSVEADHTIRMPTQVTDSQGGSGPTTLVDRLLLRPGDIVLLCSDGLTDALSIAQIQQVINTTPFADAADALIRRANEEGGPDNVTVTMLQVTTNSRPLVAAGAGFLSILLLGIVLFSLWPRPQLPPLAVQQPAASPTPAALPTFTAHTVLAANQITNTPSPATGAAAITSDPTQPSSTPPASQEASVAVTATDTQTATTVTEAISAPVTNSGVAGVASESAFDIATNTVTASGGVAVTASVTISSPDTAALPPTPAVTVTATALISISLPVPAASTAVTQGTSMQPEQGRIVQRAARERRAGLPK